MRKRCEIRAFKDINSVLGHNIYQDKKTQKGGVLGFQKGILNFELDTSCPT